MVKKGSKTKPTKNESAKNPSDKNTEDAKNLLDLTQEELTQHDSESE